MLLKTTADLIENWHFYKSDYYILRGCVATILQIGKRADAEAVLELALRKNLGFEYYQLLPIFRKFGHKAMAARLFAAYFKDKRLKDEEQEGWLELLGELKYKPIKPILRYYAFERSDDYYLCKSAVLGLLHFDCGDIQTEIQSALDFTYQKQAYFPEFLPALAAKLQDEGAKSAALANLYALGAKSSNSFTSGIVLAFGLGGEEGAAYFKRILWDEFWDITDTGVGILGSTYRVLCHLRLTFGDLYQQILTIGEPEKQNYALSRFLRLLEMKINDIEPHNHRHESFERLYWTLYPEKGQTLWDLAKNLDLQTEADACTSQLRLKIQYDLLVINIR